jgi:hypothetical protein
MHTCNSVFLNWHQRYGMKAKNVPVHFKVPFLYQKHFTVYSHSFSTNAHMRFFAAAVKQPGVPRTVKETLSSHIFLTIWCSQCVRYTSTRHLLCHMFCDHTLAEIWMLPDVYIITD